MSKSNVIRSDRFKKWENKIRTKRKREHSERRLPSHSTVKVGIGIGRNSFDNDHEWCSDLEIDRWKSINGTIPEEMFGRQRNVYCEENLLPGSIICWIDLHRWRKSDRYFDSQLCRWCSHSIQEQRWSLICWKRVMHVRYWSHDPKLKLPPRRTTAPAWTMISYQPHRRFHRKSPVFPNDWGRWIDQQHPSWKRRRNSKQRSVAVEPSIQELCIEIPLVLERTSVTMKPMAQFPMIEYHHQLLQLQIRVRLLLFNSLARNRTIVASSFSGFVNHRTRTTPCSVISLFNS